VPSLLLILALACIDGSDRQAGPLVVRVPYDAANEIELGALVATLARATGLDTSRPPGRLSVPVAGVGGNLARSTLADILGPDARLDLRDGALVVSIDRAVLGPPPSPHWRARLKRLAAHVENESRRRTRYGMHALGSYRPNDPGRPTVCLVHGLNSSSGGFVHMIKPLEDAGYGVVVYDYPFNRHLRESAEAFVRDWAAFRKQAADRQPWSVVAHSMGALLARAYVEHPRAYAGDVVSLILVAPVNHGSSLSKAQTFLQLLQGVQAVQDGDAGKALANLGDGLGEAAEDLMPGSAFLRSLNGRPRRVGVAYHILAGDGGFIAPATRAQLENQIAALRRNRGLLGAFSRLATADLSTRLDELSLGYGDGCVAVSRTRLDGVDDHVVIRANHAELIRAPLLFRDPGPVPCMPYLLRWLPQSEGKSGIAKGKGNGKE
jgi:pimeloyl-ACP methyl ester carboxylesterase